MTAGLMPGCIAMTDREVAEKPWEAFAGMHDVRVKYLSSSAATVAGLMQFDAGAREARHLHAGAQHDVWVVEGAVLFDGVRLEQGSYLHVPGGVTHTMRSADEGSCTIFFVYAKVNVT